jgi:hypothetical protein
MPNHVHPTLTPAGSDGLRATFAEAHRRNTGTINARFGWTGHLFQGRFGAVVMDATISTRAVTVKTNASLMSFKSDDSPGGSAKLSGRQIDHKR